MQSNNMHNLGETKHASPFAKTLALLPATPSEFSEVLAKMASDGDLSELQTRDAPSPFESIAGQSVLHLMPSRILFDSLDILPAIRTLARMGVDLDSTQPRSPLKTALCTGTGRNRLQFARALLMAGASVDGIPSEHASPLHEAVGMDNLDGALLLLEFGADLERRDKSGRTPLHEAVNRDHVDACRLLLLAGADLTAVDERGLTPLQVATHRQLLPTHPKMSPREDCVPVLLQEAARRERMALDSATPQSTQDGAPRARI